jgi:hypothetical protein
MKVTEPLTPETMHRGAKMFMDNGAAPDYATALATLRDFRLTISVAPEALRSRNVQVALLTAVNVARRSFLGGVFVCGCVDVECLSPLTATKTMRAAVNEMGGKHAEHPEDGSHTLLIGEAKPPSAGHALRLTWRGWSGGVVSVDSKEFTRDDSCPLGAVLAACIGVGEMFQFMTGNVPGAGRREVGLSLWKPSAIWTDEEAIGPKLEWLPSSLWLIGLGNLGQAYAWCIGALPYAMPREVTLVLQDFDRIEVSNDSTSVLTTVKDVGRRKTRMAAAWAERIGFDCRLIERRFGAWTIRSDEAEDPAVALCGVDNAYARASLEDAGFSLIAEAGLGGGPNGYSNLSVHSFPSARTARAIWGGMQGSDGDDDRLELPAYQAARTAGSDICGLLTLASKAVGVPFVGLIAGTLVIAELLRRIHGGEQIDVVSMPLSSPDDREVVVSVKSTPFLGAVSKAALIKHPT